MSEEPYYPLEIEMTYAWILNFPEKYKRYLGPDTIRPWLEYEHRYYEYGQIHGPCFSRMNYHPPLDRWVAWSCTWDFQTALFNRDISQPCGTLIYFNIYSRLPIEYVTVDGVPQPPIGGVQWTWLGAGIKFYRSLVRNVAYRFTKYYPMAEGHTTKITQHIELVVTPRLIDTSGLGGIGVPDGRIDMRDVGPIAKLFGSIRDENGVWHNISTGLPLDAVSQEQCTNLFDINMDGKIDMRDTGLITSSFGWHS